MAEWIPFAEGKYRVERAVLLARDDRAVELEEAVIEIVEDPSRGRRLRGRGRVMNARVVELLDEGHELDLLLDLGGEFKYRCGAPGFRAARCLHPGSNPSSSSFRNPPGSRSRRPTSIP